MPTYQYACTACSERLEAVQTFTDAPLTECPACGGALRKVFSAVGVVFKGSGFYKTDSRSAPTSSGSSESKGSGEAKTSTTSGDSSGSSTSSSSSDSSSSSSAKPASTSTSSTPASKTA